MSEHYVICNDTLECLLVRQAGTEETVSVASRVALPYSWRTQRQPQVSHVTLPYSWRTQRQPQVSHVTLSYI